MSAPWASGSWRRFLTVRYYIKAIKSRPPLVAASAAASITGTSGVWTDVSPAGLSLVGTDNAGDNFGVMDVLAHPTSAGTFYAFTCYQGCWKSTDYGLTWAKVSTAGGPLDNGKAWGEAIAPDGSYMLATSGNNFTAYGAIDGRRQIFKSTDGGVTWTAKGDMGYDPYDIDIDPLDKTHCITTGHDSNHLSESIDSGETWTDKGAMGTSSTSGYVHFLGDSNTVLQVSQKAASEGQWRGTKSAGTWTWTLVTDLAGAEHSHGSHQIVVDAVNGAIFTGGADTGLGVFKSTNNGVNWTNVYASDIVDAICATATKFYGARSFPNNGPGLVYAPKVTSATRNPGTSWAAPTDPAAFNNGPKRMATATDGARWVIVAGCWCGGILRYVE